MSVKTLKKLPRSEAVSYTHLQASLNTPLNASAHNRVIMDIYFNGIFSAIVHQIQSPNEMNDEELLAIISGLFTKWYWPCLLYTSYDL